LIELKHMLRMIGIVVLILASTMTSRADGMTPIKTTVCEVSAHPTRFAGKRVTISAQLNSDGIERVTLTDKSCEDAGIAVLTPEHFAGEAAFIKALQTGHPGTLDKTISGTFTGVFRWQPEKMPKRALLLKEAQRIEVVMKEQ
jgi:hypothetical protein